VAKTAIEINPGEIRRVKLTSGAWVEARFIGAHEIGGALRMRARTRYVFQNLATGRTITLKSRAKIRKVA
jgi:hypothetical protein